MTISRALRTRAGGPWACGARRGQERKALGGARRGRERKALGGAMVAKRERRVWAPRGVDLEHMVVPGSMAQ